MMNKIGLVIAREYKVRVFKKSFILMTLLMPLLMVGLMFVPVLIEKFVSAEDNYTVAVLDHTGKYENLFKEDKTYHFIMAGRSLEEYRQEMGKSDEVSAVLEIRKDLQEDPKALSLYSLRTLPSDLEHYINDKLSEYLTEERLETQNLTDMKQQVEENEVKMSIDAYRWEKDGTSSISSGDFASVLGIVLSMSIYIFLMAYGGMVMQGVLEEKKNRIMEVMISSIRPFELMMGKIIGIGLVGLTQLIFWVLILSVLSIVASLLLIDPTTSSATLSQLPTVEAPSGEIAREIFALVGSVNYWELIPLLFLYFIGGYLLYASLMAGLASAVSNDEDARQFMLPMSLIMMASFYIGMAANQNPEGSMAFWTSMVPFTSPTVMMTRLVYGVPFWQELLSLLLLYLSFVLTTYIAAKIYRVGVLMYGKKVTFKEIIKWIRVK